MLLFFSYTEPTFDASIANCDFESDLCQYTQDQGIGSLWRRVSVKPNIFRNGDHTSGAGRLSFHCVAIQHMICYELQHDNVPLFFFENCVLK